MNKLYSKILYKETWTSIKSFKLNQLKSIILKIVGCKSMITTLKFILDILSMQVLTTWLIRCTGVLKEEGWD